MATKKPLKFKWSDRRQEYVYGNHKHVRHETLKSLVGDAVIVSEARLGQLAEKLKDGHITRATWKIAAATELKNLHLAVGVLAGGGIAQMKPSRYNRITARLRKQLTFLDKFDRKVRGGKVDLDDKFIARAMSYARSAGVTFENLVRQRQQQAGALYEQRFTGAREKHCATCVAQAGLGKQAKGVLKEIGDSECGTNCDCVFEFFTE